MVVPVGPSIRARVVGQRLTSPRQEPEWELPHTRSLGSLGGEAARIIEALEDAATR
jgi:hypothetical protein